MREREREAREMEVLGTLGSLFLNLTQTTGSDRAVTSAQALLRMEGWREKQREAGDDALGEAGMRKILRREREREASNKRPTTYIWV